jgi:hypothetical protein
MVPEVGVGFTGRHPGSDGISRVIEIMGFACGIGILFLIFAPWRLERCATSEREQRHSAA